MEVEIRNSGKQEENTPRNGDSKTSPSASKNNEHYSLLSNATKDVKNGLPMRRKRVQVTLFALHINYRQLFYLINDIAIRASSEILHTQLQRGSDLFVAVVLLNH